MKGKFKVLLAPTKEAAESVSAEATVEAEYGDYCVEGTMITLAHHGSRANRPAPCNVELNPLEGGTILVSHIDLDTIGGCLAIMGEKPAYEQFWKAAEMIDVQGAHHAYKLPEKIQNELNAVWSWNDEQPRERHESIIDVTAKIEAYAKMLDIVLDDTHPEYPDYIQKGKEWAEKGRSLIESKLQQENDYIRCFVTDGPFCAASYYSPNTNSVKEATVTLNTKFNAITVAFEDGGKKCSAQKIVKELWGPEAGGRDGIAGSPRNWNLSEEQVKQEYEKAVLAVNKEIILEKLTHEAVNTDNMPDSLKEDKDICNAVLEYIDKNIECLLEEQVTNMITCFDEQTYNEVYRNRYPEVQKKDEYLKEDEER